MCLKEKTYLITNFVDTSYFSNTNHSTTGDTVVFISRLEPVQNPEVIINAFKIVNKEFPNAKLNLVGYGSLFESFKQNIKELNLDHAINLLGKQTDIRRFLWSSDIFVATNFGYIASLEAMSAGLAVIAPEFGIFKETILHGNNGLMFEHKNAQQLAISIISLLKDKEYRQSLALGGLETAKNYDINAVAPKMAEVYQAVIKK